MSAQPSARSSVTLPEPATMAKGAKNAKGAKATRGRRDGSGKKSLSKSVHRVDVRHPPREERLQQSLHLPVRPVREARQQVRGVKPAEAQPRQHRLWQLDDQPAVHSAVD